jgi:phytoene dehydrogenase-like protein
MRKYELVVVGGGFAGVAAAIAAARAGVDVLLVDKGNCLGGAAVNCLVSPFMPYSTVIDGKHVVLSAGIFSEIIRRMGRIPDPHDAQMTGHFDWVMYELGDSFKQWFFGHWHLDEPITPRFRCIWYDLLALTEDGEGGCYVKREEE